MREEQCPARCGRVAPPRGRGEHDAAVGVLLLSPPTIPTPKCLQQMMLPESEKTLHLRGKGCLRPAVDPAWRFCTGTVVDTAQRCWQTMAGGGIKEYMGEKQSECSACVQRFELDADGNVPAHHKRPVGMCCGSNRPPANRPTGWRSRPWMPGTCGTSLLPDSKEDFEISSGMSIVGHPGSGRRR